MNIFKQILNSTFQNKYKKLYYTKKKFIKNSTYIHFIPFIKSINYKITFKISLITNKTNTYSTLQNLQIIFQHNFQNLNIYLKFIKFYTFINQPYSILQIKPQNKKKTTIYLKLIIKQSNLLNKTTIKKKLLHFKHLTINYNNISYTFQKNINT